MLRSQVAAAVGAVTLVAGVAAGCSSSVAPPAEPSRAATSATAPSATGPATTGPSAGAPGSARPRAGATSRAPVPATTPVPQRSPGNVNSQVPTRTVATAPPRALDKPAAVAGVSVRLTSVHKTKTKAVRPGEVSGPGLVVRLTAKNTTGATVALGNVVVGLVGADSRPGLVMSGPPAKPLPARLTNGRTAAGTYVFAVSSKEQQTVTLTVSVVPGQTVLQFRGQPS